MVDKDETLHAEIPQFITDLAEDNPKLAQHIQEVLPDWMEAVNKATGIPNYAEKTLEAMEYIGIEKLREFVTGTAQEIEQLLRTDPRKLKFITVSNKSRSGAYFYEAIKSQLSLELQDKIQLVQSGDLDDELKKDEETIWLLVDDLLNSGQQLYYAISPLADYARKNETKQLNVLVRALASTDYVKNEKIRILRNIAGNHGNFEIDLKAARVPTMADILGQVDTYQEHLPLDLYMAHHMRNTGVLIFCAHKIPDNMPAIVLKGCLTSSLQGRHIEPLFSDKDIKEYPELF